MARDSTEAPDAGRREGPYTKIGVIFTAIGVAIAAAGLVVAINAATDDEDDSDVVEGALTATPSSSIVSQRGETTAPAPTASTANSSCDSKPDVLRMGQDPSIIPDLKDETVGGHLSIHLPQCYKYLWITGWSNTATYRTPVDQRTTGVITVIVSEVDIEVDGLMWDSDYSVWTIQATAFKNWESGAILTDEEEFGCDGAEARFIVEKPGRFSRYLGDCGHMK